MQKIIAFAIIWATLNCSAYCDRGITASGEYVRQGICAMDRLNGMVVPFGSRVTLPNGAVLTVKDRFGGGLNNRLDIWIESEEKCWEFGRQILECKIEVAE